MVRVAPVGQPVTMEQVEYGRLLLGHAFGAASMYAIKCFHEADQGNRTDLAVCFAGPDERAPEPFSIMTLSSLNFAAWLDIDDAYQIAPMFSPSFVVPEKPELRSVVGKLVYSGETVALGVVEISHGRTTRVFLLDLASGRLLEDWPANDVVVIKDFQLSRRDVVPNSAIAYFDDGEFIDLRAPTRAASEAEGD